MPCRAIYWECNDSPAGAYDRYVGNKAAMDATEARIGTTKYQRLKEQCPVEDIALAQEAAKYYELWCSPYIVGELGYYCRLSQRTGYPCTCLKVIATNAPIPRVVNERLIERFRRWRETGVFRLFAERWGTGSNRYPGCEVRLSDAGRTMLRTFRSN